MKDEKTGKTGSAAPALQDGPVRYIAAGARTLRLIYRQLLFVWLSFFIMSAITYVFVTKIMHEHLLTGTDNALSYTEAVIASDLAEPATLLGGLSESLRHMIGRGHSVQGIHEFVKSASAYARGGNYRKLRLNLSSVFGTFDVFGGVFLNDGVWQPPAGYVPQQRPWYVAAVAANGAVAVTAPYEDLRETGLVVTFARRIFDRDAKPLGVVAIRVALDELLQYVVDTRLSDDGYGVLLDERLTVIAHKDASLIGKPFRGINHDTAKVADDLRHGAVLERTITNYLGEAAIASFRQIPNGWHLGIVTPVDQYYQGARSMARFLLTLGMFLAAALSLVLLHIAGAKEKADERTRIMLDAMPLCANFWDREGNNIDCNQEAVKLFGASSKQEYLRNFHKFSPEYQPCGTRSREGVLAWVQKAFEEGYCRCEWMHQTLDGELLPSEVTLVRVEHQGEFIVVACARDLRELKATMAQVVAESARRETMARWYESILNAVPLPVSVQDGNGNWTFVNRALARFIGKEAHELLGLPCSTGNLEICHTDRCAMACAKRGVKQTRFSLEGSSYQVAVEMLTDAEGEPTVFIEVVQDVTKLEQLAKQHMEAESISQAKSSFLAMVSHEIRTPMNAILGITEMQLQTGTLSPETADAFGRIYAAGYTLLGIMNDILDLSRIEAGKVELMPAQYSVASLLSDTVQLNVVRIGSKPIAFRLHVDEDMPSELFGDELRIKQILSNLLSNAIKYTDAGEVALSAAAEYGRNAEEPDVTLVCRVSDTGQGMTPEQVGRLFDEYSRFSPEANRAIEGIGLGMSITRQLVHMMDGTISVESTPRRGSIFTVRLPQERIGAGSLGREVAEGLRQLKFNLTPYMKMTHIVRDPMPYGSVLIVDDLDTNVYVTRGLLAPYGLSIDSAASGLEALAKIRSGKEYDIVFMDHMMPQMDGIETARLMRELGYNRPIIALTANAVVGQSEMFLDSGFSNYLSKPVDLRRLDMLLNRLIRDRQPPEVIAAARRQNVRPQGGNTAPAFVVDPQLARLFAQEAARAVATLEEVSANQYRGDDDIQQFIINVHSMKSALAHIGEARLAAVAGTLEQAGRKRDTFVMSAEIPSFLDALRAVIDTIRPQEEDEADGAVDEDRAYLREKLLAIQAACAAYDRKAAKGALAELRQKPWSRLTREQINTIAAHLLHSDFEEAAGVAEKTLRETG